MKKAKSEEATDSTGNSNSTPTSTAIDINTNIDATANAASAAPTSPPTATQYIAPPSNFLKLPPELQNVDFTKRISWRKWNCTTHNSNSKNFITPMNTKPTFSNPKSPALEFHVHAISSSGTCRARATTLHLPNNHSVPTPIFMPVGTKGTIKSLTTEEIEHEPSLSCPIILGNTYHLALQPGTELIREMGGLHTFMKWEHGGILTDSGGFQMVSLLKLAEITEEGVTFENPFLEKNTNIMNNGGNGGNGGDDKNKNDESDKDENDDDDDDDTTNNPNSLKRAREEDTSSPSSSLLPQPPSQSQRMLLRPEDSIRHQNNIGSDIMMALDDVVSSLADDNERFTIATYRTLRWLDRCITAHECPKEQNLFAIVQGGLDVSLGGLREQCLAGFMKRDDDIPGYAIGGLAGGESKDDFWKVVNLCCQALPDDKPRYLMGVGYPLDLVVCTALGVDMYDCVYPTRTARFGNALVRGGTNGSGTLRLKSSEFYNDDRVIMDGCTCQACAGGFTRGQLHTLLKRGNPLAASLMTNHNIAYMMFLVRGMRNAILEDQYEKYVLDFLNDHFIGSEKGGEDVPQWVRDALHAAGIDVDKR